MPRTRLFIAGELGPGAKITLAPDQSRYLGRVLRMRVGDTLSVFNGEQGEFAATITGSARGGLALTLGQAIETLAESPLRLHLVQGVSRGERMDLVIQKATELGVKRISPVLTAHGLVKLDASRAARRRTHWHKVAASACEQSGRVRPPLIDPPVPLKQWFGERTPKADMDIVLHPGAGTPFASLATPATKLCLLVGPEGGFSEAEIGDARAAGFTPATLGPRILRTETAAIAALAIAQARWGDLGLD